MAARVALYAPPAVPVERLVVVMLRGVDCCAGGLAGFEGALGVTEPQPASNKTVAQMSAGDLPIMIVVFRMGGLTTCFKRLGLIFTIGRLRR